MSSAAPYPSPPSLPLPTLLLLLALGLASACTVAGRDAGAPSAAASAQHPLSLERFEARPSLVVVLVVDQLRADYLPRFSSRFLPATQPGGAPGGYRYLMSRGAYFPFATYGLLQAMTGPGHATILTGSYPYRNGISLNQWCEAGDDGRARPVYCVEDDESPPVGGTQLPEARESPASCSGPVHPGVSPRRLVGDTVGDELKSAGWGSRVVAVSLKDRAAILLGGHHADAALWFDAQSWGWISSRYYVGADLPGWVKSLNGRVSARKGETVTFAPTGPPGGHSEGSDFRISRRIGDSNSLETQYGIEVTVDAALAAVDAYGLGKGPAPDLLALSFSTHDWLGHALGPNRIELEELTLAEDRELARLFAQLQARLPHGLDDALIVLTADHGVPPAPGFLRGLGQRGKGGELGGYLDGEAIRAAADKELVKLHGPAPRGSWVNGTVDLNYWLDRPALAARGIALPAAEGELKRALVKLVPAAAFVLTRSEVARGEVPAGLLGEHVRNGFVPDVNGDALVLVKPFFMPEGDTATHFTDYAYDVTVPLILAGPRLQPGVYATPARVIDLAPTLSFLLGVVPPALSEGRVLAEAIGGPGAAGR